MKWISRKQRLQRLLTQSGCPICKETEKFGNWSWSMQCSHVQRHRGWQRLWLWLQTRVPASELLYARKYPKESYLTERKQQP